MLENTKINIKLKLSSLWTSLMFLYIYGDYFELYAPNKIEKLLNITDVLDTPVKLFLASVLLAIPAIMISLNFFASPTLSKFLNIFFGVLFTLVVIIVASTSLYTWYSFYVFYAIFSLLRIWKTSEKGQVKFLDKAVISWIPGNQAGNLTPRMRNLLVDRW